MDTSADRVAQTEDDATALATRRLTVRAYADRIAQIVEGLDLPETFLEAERAARAITAANRIIQQLPTIPEDQPEASNKDSDADQAPVIIKPPRRRLRARADQLLEVIGRIPDPDSFLEGERAGRCLLATDRMLSQLYEAPQSPNKYNARFPKSPAFADDIDEDDSEDTDNWRAAFLEKADRFTVGYARDCGLWPDGTPFDPETPAPEGAWRMADSLTIFQCGDPQQMDRWPALLMLNRVNGVTRALARSDGRWPDYSPYSDNDPDYYSLSARYEEQVLNKPPPPDAPPGHREIPNTIGFPWWLVRIVPQHPPPPLKPPLPT